jgi:hypothetical protein
LVRLKSRIVDAVTAKAAMRLDWRGAVVAEPKFNRKQLLAIPPVGVTKG